MIFAQIKNGTVQNTIILENENLLSLFQINLITREPYDAVLRIDNINPQPGIDWSYDGNAFIAPPPIEVNED